MRQQNFLYNRTLFSMQFVVVLLPTRSLSVFLFSPTIGIHIERYRSQDLQILGNTYLLFSVFLSVSKSFVSSNVSASSQCNQTPRNASIKMKQLFWCTTEILVYSHFLQSIPQLFLLANRPVTRSYTLAETCDMQFDHLTTRRLIMKKELYSIHTLFEYIHSTTLLLLSQDPTPKGSTLSIILHRELSFSHINIWIAYKI